MRWWRLRLWFGRTFIDRPRYLAQRHFLCRRGQHWWWVMYVTDGTVRVRCRSCRLKREPTEEERRSHSHYGWSREKQEAFNKEIDELQHEIDELQHEIDEWIEESRDSW